MAQQAESNANGTEHCIWPNRQCYFDPYCIITMEMKALPCRTLGAKNVCKGVMGRPASGTNTAYAYLSPQPLTWAAVQRLWPVGCCRFSHLLLVVCLWGNARFTSFPWSIVAESYYTSSIMESSSDSSAVPSLSRFRPPELSDLAQKRQIQCKPPRGVKKENGSVAADPITCQMCKRISQRAFHC